MDVEISTHEKNIANICGYHGIIDRSGPESAVNSTRNVKNYLPNADCFDVAASLITGIIRDYSFVDANKGTGVIDEMTNDQKYEIGIKSADSSIHCTIFSPAATMHPSDHGHR